MLPVLFLASTTMPGTLPASMEASTESSKEDMVNGQKYGDICELTNVWQGS